MRAECGGVAEVAGSRRKRRQRVSRSHDDYSEPLRGDAPQDSRSPSSQQCGEPPRAQSEPPRAHIVPQREPPNRQVANTEPVYISVPVLNEDYSILGERVLPSGPLDSPDWIAAPEAPSGGAALVDISSARTSDAPEAPSDG